MYNKDFITYKEFLYKLDRETKARNICKSYDIDIYLLRQIWQLALKKKHDVTITRMLRVNLGIIKKYKHLIMRMTESEFKIINEELSKIS